MKRWTRRPLPLTLLALLLGLTMACQETTRVGNPAPDEAYDGPPDRYSELPDLDLDHGEAKPGIHLQPGIELIPLRIGSDSPLVEIDDDAGTVTLSGEARERLEEQEEVWTEDILLGDDFIYLISHIREEGDRLVVEVEPFELLRVVHGEWDLGFGDDAPSSSMLWATIDDDGQVSLAFRPFLEFALGDLKARAQVTDADVGGQISFPIDWEGQFRGKVSALGRGLNPDYECQAYTETVTRRRIPFVRDAYEFEREVQPERFCIDYLLAMGTVGLNAEAQASIETTGTLTYDASDKVELGRPQRAPLGQTGLALWFTPFLEAGLKVAIQGSLDLGLDAGASVAIPLGFEYDPHGEGFSFLPNDRFPVERGGHLDPSIEETTIDEATLTLFTKLGMKYSLSDVLSDSGLRITGPEAGLEFGQEISLEPNKVDEQTQTPGPCLTTLIYLEAFGSGNLRAEAKITKRWSWGIDLVDYDPENLRFALAQDASEGSEFCVEQTPTPELAITVTWSDPSAVDLFVKPPDEVEIGPDNTQTTVGQYHPADAGCQDGPECMAYVEWINLNDAYQSEPFRIWARNTSGATAVDAEVAVIRDGQPLQTWQIMLPAAAGATSNPILFNYQGRD